MGTDTWPAPDEVEAIAAALHSGLYSNRQLATACAMLRALSEQRALLVNGQGLPAGIIEALNSGDGAYRP